MKTRQLLTAEDLWAMPEAPGKRFELVRGEVVEVSGAGLEHAQLVLSLVLMLRPVVVAGRLGRVYGDGLAYTIQRDPDLVRVPDVSFISAQRMPTERIRSFVPFAPDMAVEIVSPNDRADDVRAKVQEYLEAGVRMVWVLWPSFRAVTMYLPGTAPLELGEDDELDGGDVLPGFRVRVGALFDLEEG